MAWFGLLFGTLFLNLLENGLVRSPEFVNNLFVATLDVLKDIDKGLLLSSFLLAGLELPHLALKSSRSCLGFFHKFTQPHGFRPRVDLQFR